MKMKLTPLFLAMLLSLVFAGMAQATYYHFEDYGTSNIPFHTGTTYTWTFNLNSDALKLWLITDVPEQNVGANWTDPADRIGSMGAEDILHRAYLTMKFCDVQNDGDVEEIDFTLDLTDTISWFLHQGGLLNQSIAIADLEDLPDEQNAPGTLNVFSYLKEADDHMLKVTITSLTGDFTVCEMNLAGCYAPNPTPVPEPGTVALLGAGLAGIAVVLRRRTKTAAGRR